MAGWKCQKRISLFCCPVFGDILLFFPVDVVQNNCILSCYLLLEVELALWLCFVHLALVQIDFVFLFVFCVVVYYLRFFVLFWNAGTARKKRRSLRGWLFAKRSGAGWLTIVFCAFLLFLLYKIVLKLSSQQLCPHTSQLLWTVERYFTTDYWLKEGKDHSSKTQSRRLAPCHPYLPLGDAYYQTSQEKDGRMNRPVPHSNGGPLPFSFLVLVDDVDEDVIHVVLNVLWGLTWPEWRLTYLN